MYQFEGRRNQEMQETTRKSKHQLGNYLHIQSIVGIEPMRHWWEALVRVKVIYHYTTNINPVLPVNVIIILPKRKIFTVTMVLPVGFRYAILRFRAI